MGANAMLLQHQQCSLAGLRAGSLKSGRRPGPLRVQAAASVETAPAQSVAEGTQEPLLVRAVRNQNVERPPVWMMRQAGRYMQVYKDLCAKHKTFRERSENTDLAVEISLQPWRAFKPDGVILFSDILTPLAGMNIDFDIVTGKGPLIAEPIRSMAQVEQVTPLVPQECVPFVGEALTQLRAEVAGSGAAVLGFVGAPFTLATYIVEGGSSKDFAHTKAMMFRAPKVLHALLGKLAEAVADYVRYQADAGAEAVQIFDSWASKIAPQEFDVFCGPYIKQIIDSVRTTHPDLPIIVYISGSGGLLERIAATGPDIVSVDGSVHLADAIRRIGPSFAVQGNVGPDVLLYGDKATIERRVVDVVRAAEGTRHIINTGHGVLQNTPEENVAHFFEVARTVKERL